MVITRLRRWLPVIACALLLLSSFMAVGVVCVCASNHQLQSIERALTVIPAATPAVIEVWALVLISLCVVLCSQALGADVAQRGRASPDYLQRFLF